MATNNAINIATGAANTVLIGNGVAQNPTFSASPQLTALGLGAAAGASGVTFNGTDLLNNYTVGTFTPTMTGTSTAGTTTYTTQIGRYTRIGNRVIYFIYVAWSAVTGTGNIQFGGLPVSTNSTTSNNPPASVFMNPASATITFGAGFVYPQAIIRANSTAIDFWGWNSASGAISQIGITASGSIMFSGEYEV